jgi:hypothetical protein
VQRRTFSVFNPQSGGYDYYQATGKSLASGVFAPIPNRKLGKPLGLTPEEAAERLPSGARLVGRGAMPQGTIATLGGSDTFDMPPTWLLIAAAGFIAWRFKWLST